MILQPDQTVENPDGTITHEGRRYVPAERHEALQREIENLRGFCKGVAININRMLETHR